MGEGHQALKTPPQPALNFLRGPGWKEGEVPALQGYPSGSTDMVGHDV